MQYVYVLYMNELPIYAGLTNNPIKRYLAHYYHYDSSLYSYAREMLALKGKLLKMKIVYCNTDRSVASEMEKVAIRVLHIHGFKIFNGGSFVTINSRKRLPANLLTRTHLQHIINSQREILIEYGYNVDRYVNMDNSTSPRKRNGNQCSAG